MNLVLLGLIGSGLAGIATGVGALPAMVTTRVSRRALNAMLGFAAGVMLGATAFSLLIPAIKMGGVWLAMLGLVLGVAFLALLDRCLPHEHFQMGPEGPSSSLRRTWLFVIAITLHNFPEGMAVGVGFGSGRIGEAVALAIGIGLQNMPEGLAVALPLIRERYTRGKALLIAALSGLVEPVGGVLGAAAVTAAHVLLPVGLAFAAGAMLFVIVDEIIPETHHIGETGKASDARLSTYGLVGGFVVMTLLDNLLG